MPDYIKGLGSNCSSEKSLSLSSGHIKDGTENKDVVGSMMHLDIVGMN